MLLVLDLGRVVWPVVGMLALAAVVAFLAKTIGKKGGVESRDPDGPWPYRVRRLMTDPEQVLLHRVRSALPGHLVFAQVQVARVLEVSDRSDSLGWFNRIAQLSFDILVCTQDTTPVLAIELDDSSHGRQRQRKRDAKKDRACNDAGLRLVRWNVQSIPSVEMIQAEVLGTARPVSAQQGVKE